MVTEATEIKPSLPDTYQKEDLETRLSALGYKLLFAPEVQSTMDAAQTAPQVATVIIADHQSKGKGRWDRSWEDKPKQSILMTVIEPLSDYEYELLQFSLVPNQLFSLAACIALQQETGVSGVKVRWIDDLSIGGKKLGGLLTAKGIENKRVAKTLHFGMGINVHYPNADIEFPNTEYGAVSLAEAGGNNLDRTALVAAIVRQWADFRPDLARIVTHPPTQNYFDQLWQKHSALQYKNVTIFGHDIKNLESETGFVVESHLGRGLQLETAHGPTEIVGFHPHTRIIENS